MEPVSPKNDFATYITELFEKNPELKRTYWPVRDAVIHFSQNQPKERLERFANAWGRYDTYALATMLQISEKMLQNFFGILLTKLS